MASQKQASTAPQPQFAPAPEALPIDEPEGPRQISAVQDVSLDDADHKLSQSEMKDRAIKHLFDVIHSGTVNEEHAKAIFDRYDSRSAGTWTSQDLRLFLFDLQEAFQCPRVVPDEALADVLKEIQLNLEASGGITWVEFKSYMLFLQQQPLEQLHETVTRHAPRERLTNAVIATSLPPKVTREHLATVFAPVAEILHLYLVEEPSIPAQALVVYPNEKAVNDAVHLTGTDILGVRIRVVRFEDQEFPTLTVVRKPGAVPQVIAKAYVAAKDFDEKAKITETISKGVDTASKQLASFAEEHKIKEKAKAVADKTGEAVKQLDDRFKISQTANELNEKYQITQKAQKAKEQVLANQHVQAVGGFFSNLAAKVTQSYQEFADETREAINEEQRKKAGPAPNQFEMGARGGEAPQTPGGPQ